MIDLHTHTNASDANLSREQLLTFAALCGIKTVAITDHDTLKNSYVQPDDPVQVIVGCELSAYDKKISEKVHILCYLPKNVKPLLEYFEQIKAERNRVGNEMLEKVHRLFPIITWESVAPYMVNSGVIFKQTIMSVMIEYGYTTELFGAMYYELFNKRSGSCYVNMTYGLTDEVLEIAHASRGVVVLAHPSVYRNMPLATTLAKDKRIDGIEIDHPRNTMEDRVVLQQLCADYNLLTTGGSDFHGANSGRSILPGDGQTTELEYGRLMDLGTEK